MQDSQRSMILGSARLIVVSLFLVGCSSGTDGTTSTIGAAAGGGLSNAEEGVSINSATIVRDGEGTPHIFAATADSVFRGLGYAHARDRIFHMDFSRRYTEGRLSELFWEDVGSSPNNDWVRARDERMRHLSLAQHNEEVIGTLPTQIQRHLQAYADGVNDFLTSGSFQLPVIYLELGFDPTYQVEPWEATDCLNVWDRITHVLDSGNMQEEIWNLGDLQCDGNGYIDCDCSAPRPIDEAAAIVPEPPGWQSPCGGFVPGLLDDDRGIFGELEFIASHTFALAPDRSAQSSGPLLFCDPKIQVTTPSFFYPAHLAVVESVGCNGTINQNANRLNVQGVGFAGCPGMLIFWNSYVAQSVTSAGGDISDLYEITVFPPGANPATATQYVFNGQVFDFVTRTEDIDTRVGTSFSIQVRETVQHGPIVNSTLLAPASCPTLLNDRLFAMKHLEREQTGTHSLVASMRAMASDSFASYRASLNDWVGPTVHMVYAGVDNGAASASEGHIAYHYGGGIPCRPAKPAFVCSTSAQPNGDMRGRLPYNGANPAELWGSKLGAADRPTIVDPPEGYLFSGNHLAVGSWYEDEVRTGIRANGDTYRSFTLRVRLEEDLLPNPTDTMTDDQAWQLHSDAASKPSEFYADMLHHLGVLDVADTYMHAPVPPNGPATTRAEKAWKVMEALDLWLIGNGKYEQSDSYWPLVHEAGIAMVQQGRFQSGNPGAIASQMSCKWHEGEGGVVQFIKAFRSNSSVVELCEPDVTPCMLTIEAEYILNVAEQVWDLMVAPATPDCAADTGQECFRIDRAPGCGYGLPDDPATWPSTVIQPFAVPYYLHFFCPQANKTNCCLSAPAGQPVTVFLDKWYKNSLNSAQYSVFPGLLIFDEPQNRYLGYFPAGLTEDPNSALFINPAVKDMWEADARCELLLNGAVVLPENPLDPGELFNEPDTGDPVFLELPDCYQAVPDFRGDWPQRTANGPPRYGSGKPIRRGGGGPPTVDPD